MPEIPLEKLNELMEKLHQGHGVDFRGYKPSSLTRRVQRRIDAARCADIDAYISFLDRRPDEYSELIDSILINVTQFFRDPEAWVVLRTEILPQIIAGKKPGDKIRIWSAGCATGEEVYSLAISLTEALGPGVSDYEIKLFATDIDDAALGIARKAEYSNDSMRFVPPELCEAYFTYTGEWTLNQNTRKMVVFGHHNLATDAPISHLDLITCRNVLIYMSVDLQNHLLSKFHYGLEREGFLFLGKAESLLNASKTFCPVSEKWRIFKRGR